ncbi:glycosyltransferase family 1 protein [Paenibacillus agricola]|uniref:Glycosyltransferase family 1 protein n=1 Tax=Paenibacillus agricola TaxID=2716264 RepID=A0ABX0JEZ6_9BACL|nr:glycosyltransferase family 1 protein [Paenibacillus agricola]
MNRGGLETLIMNIYRNIDRSHFQFDFLVHQEFKGAFDDEIIRLGGKIHYIPYITKIGHFGYIKALNNFFKTHQEYNIVHSHMNSISGLILRSAKKKGINVRIAHSHSSKHGTSFFEKIYKKCVSLLISSAATHFFACSKIAGESLFGKRLAKRNTTIIKNGVDLNKFIFNNETRDEIRKELEGNDKTIIIGHVGRFQEMKNHTYLIDVFSKLIEKKPNALLVFVGDGELRTSIEQKVKNLNLTSKVKFLGIRDDVHKIMQAFDVFVMPSLYEGLPVTLVEAQATGIRCVVSENITREIDLGVGLVDFISLKETLFSWVELLLKENDKYINSHTLLKLNGYDIVTTTNWLEKFYSNFSKQSTSFIN